MVKAGLSLRPWGALGALVVFTGCKVVKAWTTKFIKQGGQLRATVAAYEAQDRHARQTDTQNGELLLQMSEARDQLQEDELRLAAQQEQAEYLLQQQQEEAEDARQTQQEEHDRAIVAKDAALYQAGVRLHTLEADKARLAQALAAKGIEHADAEQQVTALGEQLAQVNSSLWQAKAEHQQAMASTAAQRDAARARVRSLEAQICSLRHDLQESQVHCSQALASKDADLAAVLQQNDSLKEQLVQAQQHSQALEGRLAAANRRLHQQQENSSRALAAKVKELDDAATSLQVMDGQLAVLKRQLAASNRRLTTAEAPAKVSNSNLVVTIGPVHSIQAPACRRSSANSAVSSTPSGALDAARLVNSSSSSFSSNEGSSAHCSSNNSSSCSRLASDDACLDGTGGVQAAAAAAAAACIQEPNEQLGQVDLQSTQLVDMQEQLASQSRTPALEQQQRREMALQLAAQCQQTVQLQQSLRDAAAAREQAAAEYQQLQQQLCTLQQQLENNQ